MRRLNRDRRVAVTGLAGSGKTVFLLSLLQHLEYAGPRRFRTAGRGELGSFRELPPRAAAGFEAFPRRRLWNSLIDPQGVSWPEKTTRPHSYRCSFDYGGLGLAGRLWNTLSRGAWLSRRVLWEFLDFPGERLSDSLMAGHEDFSAWSDALLGLWEEGGAARDGMAGYLSRLGSPTAGEAELLLAYKRSLAGLAGEKRQLVTPSSFMLGTVFAEPLSSGDLGREGADRLSGLPGGEFSPLPGGFGAVRPDLREEFSRRYRAYRETVVLPLFKAVNACDTLLLVVDIPGILTGGAGRHRDVCRLTESLAGNLKPAGWLRGRADRLALIAAKADMVHQADLDSLKGLADDLLRLAQNRSPDLPGGHRAFAVSSWVSSRSEPLSEAGRLLRGVPARGGAGTERVFRVPELPAEWPSDWRAEDPAHSYPRLSPPRLANRFTAPEQWNLEQVFDFIASGG